MVLQDYIEINITGRNKKFYQDKGYICEHGDTIKVKNEDINNSSHIKEIRICDECGCEIIKTHQCFIRSRELHGKDLCSKCSSKQANDVRRKTCEKKYGVDSVAKLDSVKNSKKESCLEKYGVDNPMKVSEFVSKSQKTKEEIYGENCYKEFSIKANLTHKEKTGYNIYDDPIAIQKRNNTCIKKYGYECSLENKDIRDKCKETSIEKYGSENPMKNKDVFSTWQKSMYKYGNVKTSSQQYEIYKKLQEYYPQYTIELNKPFSKYFLDICISELKIDIEYDGTYWHKNKEEKDKLRDEELYHNGYRIIRISSERSIPSLEEIIECINNNKQFNLIKL